MSCASSTRRPAASPPPSRPAASCPATTSPSSARPPGRWSPPSRAAGWPVPPSWCCRCRCGWARIEEFVDQTRARIRHADAELVLIDPDAGRRSIEPAAGDPPIGRWRRRSPGRAGASAERWERPGRRSRALGDPAVHERLDDRPEGRDAPAPRARRQPRRHRRRPPRSTPTTTSWSRGCRSTTTWVSSGCSSMPMTTGVDLVLGAPAGLPRRARRLDAVDLRPTAARPPPVRTSRGCSRPGRSRRMRDARPVAARASRSTAPSRSTRPRSRRSSRPAQPYGFRPVRVFPAFGMAEVAIGGAFPEPDVAAWCTDPVDRRGARAPSAMPRPVDAGGRRACVASPSSAGRCRASRSGSSTPSTGDELPEREVGELEIRGTSVTPGYYKRPDVTAALVPRRLAAHRRPRLPRRRRAGGVRAHQGRDHRRRSQRVPRGHRAGRRPTSTVSAPATSSPSASRRHKGKERPSSWSPRSRSDDHDEVRRAVAPASARRRAACRPRTWSSSSPARLPKTSSGKLQRCPAARSATSRPTSTPASSRPRGLRTPLQSRRRTASPALGVAACTARRS